MTITFSTFLLISKKKIDFISIFGQEEAEVHFTHKAAHYLVDTEILDDAYLWIYMRYGSQFPYGDKVYNVSTYETESNPRSTNQVETSHQLFAILDLNKLILYVSHPSKKSTISSYLHKKTENEISIKMIIADIDGFIDMVKSIEEIKFTSKSNLLNQDESFFSIFAMSKDICGLGAPTTLRVSLEFSHANVTNQFVECLRNMLYMQRNNSIDTLICIGLDDRGIETIFNTETLINKHHVKIRKDECGVYNSEAVKSAFLSQIEGYYEKGT